MNEMEATGLFYAVLMVLGFIFGSVFYYWISDKFKQIKKKSR